MCSFKTANLRPIDTVVIGKAKIVLSLIMNELVADSCKASREVRRPDMNRIESAKKTEMNLLPDAD